MAQQLARFGEFQKPFRKIFIKLFYRLTESLHTKTLFANYYKTWNVPNISYHR